MMTITDVLGKINDLVWGVPLMVLIIAGGLLLTIRLRCLQTHKLGLALKWMVKNEEGGVGEVSSFAALCTALSATIGTGNIVGVASAVTLGGPGALFWMEVAAFLGMATKYTEGLLAVKYRSVDPKSGRALGGPFYYIERGMGKNWTWLAKLFAIFGILAGLLGIGTITQVNGITGAIKTVFDPNDLHMVRIPLAGEYSISVMIGAIVVVIAVALVLIGGIRRIAHVSEVIVPFMAILYIVSVLILVITNIKLLPAAVVTIVKAAFSPRAITGGAVGSMMVAMQKGVARGIFSNEAGLGSAPIAHAASSTEEPCEQAIWGVFEVFIDTIVICSITAMAVILSGVLNTDGGLDAFASKGAAAAAAFNTILPGTFGGLIIELSLLFFALSTILSWAYYGENCWGYLTNNNKVIVTAYKVIFSLVCIVGAVGSGTLMWDIADTLNGLMAIPNLIALLMLSGVVTSVTKEYFSKNMLK